MGIVVSLAVSYACVLALLLVLENHIIFIPSKDLWTSPAQAGVAGEDVATFRSQ